MVSLKKLSTRGLFHLQEANKGFPAVLATSDMSSWRGQATTSKRSDSTSNDRDLWKFFRRNGLVVWKKWYEEEVGLKIAGCRKFEGSGLPG